MDSQHLIDGYLLGTLNDDEVRQLNQLLLDNPDLRHQFAFTAEVDSSMRDLSIERSIEAAQQEANKPPNSTVPRISTLGSLLLPLAIAASLLMAIAFWAKQPSPIATLLSSENAAWESALPTSPGSDLSAGTLDLKAGVATIRFRSGAELVLEAPARLDLVSPMKARMDSGAAVVNVPDSAKGFVLETPSGYAIDYGTRFAVHIDKEGKQSGFELIEGEIEVHHPETGESLRLNQVGAAVAVSKEEMTAVEPDVLESSAEPVEQVIRIGTNGRCGTAMPRFVKRHKFIDPGILSVKRSGTGKWDYRSFFSFDLTDVDLSVINEAAIRLNLVPSHRGLASRLPKVNRFRVYGMTNKDKQNWKIESTWEEAPDAKDGVLLGTFEVQRSQQRGVFGVSGDALLKFLKSHAHQDVTFILVRETTQIEGVGPGLTHMFASDIHPESVGPLLELSTQ